MKTKNARKSNKNISKGQPGAPKKPVVYPRGNFTVQSAIELNKSKKIACGLTVRNRITADVEAGLLVENGRRAQPNGAVGRPSILYILATMAKKVKAKTKARPKAPTAIKATRKTKANTVTLEPVTEVTPAVPAPAPVTNVATSPAVGGAEMTTVSGEKVIPPVVPAPLP